MEEPGETPAPPPDLAELVRKVRERTPARLLVGRSGTAYRTSTLLELRLDHAFARDAVAAEVDLARDLGPGFLERWGLFEVRSRAASKAEFLLRPELGRSLSDEAVATIRDQCPAGADLQVAVADGLSAAAVVAQVPELLAALAVETGRRGWSLGRPFFVRYGRVGLLNDIGRLLEPRVIVLLIGERPGLVTAESLSAYMAYQPRPGQTDADRNLVANIHARGVPPAEAARRVLNLADQMIRLGTSGVAVKEGLEAPALTRAPDDPPA